MRLEDTIQEAVVLHLIDRGIPGLVWWHTANGARLVNRYAQMAALKRRGFRNGVSDLILFHDKRLYCLELKTPKGVATEAQQQFMADMREQGAYTWIAQGLDEAIMFLELHGLLKGKAA